MKDCFYRVSIKALIYDPTRTKYLLVRESNNYWELPGGGLDFGEKPHNCIKRELKEEMRLETIFISSSPIYFFTFRDFEGQNVANVIYEVKVKNLNFTPSEECVEIGFFTKEEINKLEKVYPNITELIKLI